MSDSAYCPKCVRNGPVTYGYSDRISGAVTLDAGGPVNLTRVMSTTSEQTFCAKCGYRVFTKPELQKLEQQELNRKSASTIFWIFAALFVVLLLVAVIRGTYFLD